MLSDEEISVRIVDFQNDLRILDPLDVVRKNVIFGGCAMLDDRSYFDLRNQIAAQYSVHPNEVLIVGSSKLGFSIAPKKRFRPFSDSSDIDVVVISSELFSKVWGALYDYERTGGYWPKSGQFKEYLFQGWIRPDKLPPARSFSFAKEWWEFFNKISASRKYSIYRVNGALYKDWRFLESYQLRSVDGCASTLELESSDENERNE